MVRLNHRTTSGVDEPCSIDVEFHHDIVPNSPIILEKDIETLTRLTLDVT
jgi:hypothetical protein